MAQIQQVSPTGGGKANLHYGGTGTPDKATLKLVVDEEQSKDIDKNVETLEERDAGLRLDAADITWSVDPAKAGTLVANGYDCEFTPGKDVAEGIIIKATIKEGKKYSYWSESYDSDAEVKHSGLNTFKVGVKLVAGGKDQFVWEDAKSTLVKDIGTKDFTLTIPWTGKWAEPGVITKSVDFPGKANNDYTWTAVARSAKNDLTAVQGTINFRPAINVVGRYRMYHVSAGLLPPGAGGVEAIKQLAGAINPYVKAAVDIIAAATRAAHTWQGGMAGCSVIEEVDVKKMEYVWTEDNDNDWQTFVFLTIPGKILKKAPETTIKGSIDLTAKIVVDDDFSLSESYMQVLKRNGGQSVNVKVKCSVPTWERTGTGSSPSP